MYLNEYLSRQVHAVPPAADQPGQGYHAARGGVQPSPAPVPGLWIQGTFQHYTKSLSRSLFLFHKSTSPLSGLWIQEFYWISPVSLYFLTQPFSYIRHLDSRELTVLNKNTCSLLLSLFYIFLYLFLLLYQALKYIIYCVFIYLTSFLNILFFWFLV